ncbi:MAG TPA: SIS domain-containing protein [Bryobacteraceae bacterium]|nr:SIS domain-containing protein [Bryobacteraceae bacterium]
MPDDIRSQPDSLARVIDYQFGAGRKALVDAAAALRGAPRVIVSGMGASLYAAIPLAYRLGASGLPVTVVETSELLHYQSALCRGAAVVLVSRSGNTVEVAKLLPALRDLGATTIGVTNESDSALAREADHVLLVSSGRDEMVAVQTYTGAVMAMLLLGAETLSEPMDDWRAAAGQTVAAVSAAIAHFVPASSEWRAFLAGGQTMYVIGRGPSLASVHEGALLFNETAKLPSVAAPAGTFRHGPVEVAGEAFHGIVFATQEPTRNLDLALAVDVSEMGAEVVTIAPEGSWPLPHTPHAFLPVVEIVPVQLAALRAAEWRGIRPGDFRYVSQVTTSETGFKPRVS